MWSWMFHQQTRPVTVLHLCLWSTTTLCHTGLYTFSTSFIWIYINNVYIILRCFCIRKRSNSEGCGHDFTLRKSKSLIGHSSGSPTSSELIGELDLKRCFKRVVCEPSALWLLLSCGTLISYSGRSAQHHFKSNISPFFVFHSLTVMP